MSRLLPHYALGGKTAFFCCDIQGAFAPRIKNFNQLVFVANRFAALHTTLKDHTKFIVTEQYPKALGKTSPEVVIPESALVFEKTRFSMLIPEVVVQLEDVSNVVIFGLEAHVCVLQTVAELLDHKKKVVLVRDGVGSQQAFDEEAAVKLMSSWGPECFVSTSESVMFQLARDAKDPNFKAVSNLAKMQRPL